MAVNFRQYTLSRGKILVKLALQNRSEKQTVSDETLIPAAAVVDSESKVQDKSSNVHVYKEISDDAIPEVGLNVCVETVKDSDNDSNACESPEDLDDSDRDPDWAPTGETRISSKSSSESVQHSGDDAPFEESMNQRNKRKRNRKAKPEEWKRNLKKKRMHGLDYDSVKKAPGGRYESLSRPSRKVGPKCTSALCRRSDLRHCNDFTEDERQVIFNNFWSMDWDQKRVYVSSMVDITTIKEPTTKSEPSRRSSSFRYHLKKRDQRVCVCKIMFQNTLGIREKSVRTWVKSSSSAGKHCCSDDKKTPSKSKAINAERRERVFAFVDSLPKLPSHYCRSTSEKLYLQPDIRSLSQLYKIYKEQVPNFVSSKVFSEIVHERNIGLFKPKKDQCDLCCAYEVGNIDDEAYVAHREQKDRPCEEKSLDKERSSDGSCKVVTMDVQAVLMAPSLQASSLYFKRKLVCHNFTVFDLNSCDAVNYFWHEGEGGVDGSNFASCVFDYISSGIGDASELIIYSDGCTSQNRNIILSNTLLHLAVERGVLITQKFLEKGHTQMECDSVHSVIERAVRKRSIYSPANYVSIIESAREKNKYKVKYVNHSFFKNYSTLQYYTSIRPGSKVGDPRVTDVKMLKYSPDGNIYYKLKYDGSFSELPRRSKLSSRQALAVNIPSLYDGPLSITSGKFEDLQYLKRVIPADYHSFYDNLQKE